jgi:preprotein translocase subunit SecD
VASPAGHLRPGRYLALFALTVVVLYALVFFTGGGKASPKLGIDLQGGTRVTLTARTPNGGQPSRDSLNQARQIIETRVNGIGVGGTEVLLDGNNVVITVPGNQGDEAKNLGRTAKLGFRAVVEALPVTPPAATPPPTSPTTPPGSSTAKPSTPPATSSKAPAGGGGEAGAAQAPSTTPSTTPSAPSSSKAATPTPSAPPADGSIDAKTAQEIQAAKAIRQNPALIPANASDQAAVAQAQQLEAQAMASITCEPQDAKQPVKDPLVGNDDPTLPLVTCDTQGQEKFLLAPEFMPGTDISDANSNYDAQQGGNVVNLTFNSAGTKIWGAFTTANTGKRAAFVLDTQVVSAPNITTAILNGQTEISGSFTAATAKSLADSLKYGSLPLSFTASDATTVSATLGLASLQAGLIAGGIGLLVVFIYCLFYYRLLGILTILSLVLSGTLVYAVLVLLGRWIGYTLDLAGIAGLIIAIGITADSFVIYFERLKDEIREGRTFRSAVPRGWARAKRTILASDGVSFLAAAILYWLAVGDVQGFAFTLGMSTVLDLVVVYLVTHPFVALVSRSKWKFISNPKHLGLGAVQELGTQRKPTKPVVGGANVKEA